MRKIFITILIIPFVFYAQAVFCANNYNSAPKVSPSSSSAKNNISKITAKNQNYSTDVNSDSAPETKPYYFTRDEADNLFKSPAKENYFTNQQTKEQQTDYSENNKINNGKNPKWWREESNLNGWGTFFFDY